MFIHPDSFDHNYVQQYPEIFDKYEPIYFQLPGERMTDFFDSSSFLYGSQKDQDVNMIFSAIQRLSPEKFEDFQSYLHKDTIYPQLLNISDQQQMKQKINEICESYNKQFGMRRKIIDFYQKYVSAEEKGNINSKFSVPVSYKPNREHTREGGFAFVIGFLIDQRNALDHAAIYTPFHDGKQKFSHRIKVQGGEHEKYVTSNLTFQDFYEVTRRATARFWLEEYELYLQNGGKEIIKALVEEVTEQCRRINEEAENKKIP